MIDINVYVSFTHIVMQVVGFVYESTNGINWVRDN